MSALRTERASIRSEREGDSMLASVQRLKRDVDQYRHDLEDLEDQIVRDSQEPVPVWILRRRFKQACSSIVN